MSNKLLIALSVSSLFLVGCNSNNPTPTPTPVPTVVTQEQIDNVRSELENLTGQRTPSPAVTGESTNKETVLVPESGYQATGYARHSFENKKYTLTVLADLPQLTGKDTYQVWLLNQPSDHSTAKKIGQLRVSKSGYFLDFTSTEDLTSYKYFVVSRESNNDSQIENIVLTGQVE